MRPVKKRRSLNQIRVCEHCGDEYYPTHNEQKTCSRRCANIVMHEQKTGASSRGKCATCHAAVGLSATESGLLVNLDISRISAFRKNAGLPTYDKVKRRKRLNELSGKVCKKKERNAAWWRDNWKGVVDSYWDRCNYVVIAKMTDPFMRGKSGKMISYYLNHDESKRNMAGAAKLRYYRNKGRGHFNLKLKLRNQIARVCRKSKTGKTRKTIEYLGCDMNHVRDHIQRQFKKGMNWNNHGTVWEIDHIVPMSHFDLLIERNRLLVNHFTNLKPEFKDYNREKGCRFVGKHQLSML